MILVPYNLVSLAEDDTIGGGKNIVAGASVNITKVSGGSAQIYSDEAGTTLITLPTVTDAHGELLVFIEPGDYNFSINSEVYRVSISGSNAIIDSWAAISSTYVKNAGQLFTLARHTSSGLGGGTLMGFAGSVTDDGGTQKDALGGFHLKRINYQILDVSMFGCTGSGDESAALQLAFNASMALQIPLTGSGTFTSNSTLLANTGKLQLFKSGDGIGQQFKIFTAEAIELIKVTVDACSFTNIALEHNGSSGRIVKFENAAAGHMTGCSITATHATNPDPLIYTNGSNTYIKGRNSFTNLRPNAFCIDADRTDWGIHINSQFDDNYMGGTGKGLLVWSSDGSPRSEGITFSKNDLVLTGSTHVEIQVGLNVCIYDNMLDQCSGINIYLNPTAQNIEDVRIRGRYIASSVHTGVGGGVGIKLNPAATGIASGIDIAGVTFDQMSYGIVLGSKAFGVAIHSDNVFNNIDQQMLSIDQSLDARIVNNKFNSPKNISLTDGASGGNFWVDGNWFASGSSIITARTSNANFNWGFNYGQKTKGTASQLSGAIGVGSAQVDLTFAHGFVGTPITTKSLVSMFVGSGTFTKLNGFITAIDATNFTVRVDYTCTVAGTFRAVVASEI